MAQELTNDSVPKRVELVYFDGCPHWPTALERIKAALDLIGRNDPVHLRMVANEREALTHHMAGSPTILIDGRDAFPCGESIWGCRLYLGEAGPQGAPSIESLVEILS